MQIVIDSLPSQSMEGVDCGDEMTRAAWRDRAVHRFGVGAISGCRRVRAGSAVPTPPPRGFMQRFGQGAVALHSSRCGCRSPDVLCVVC